ncbi:MULTISPECIES: penicillin-binding transpeptidase domain-containing protein [Arsenicicoccus]|uniref:penicillin-binding transpeptidase domain-containing protein n=1 Tax=Arsenicicoccus TaxID=267408 RepID=UPI002580D824|nr:MULTISPECIES: penicillin-binding transpeptidase domain-containing protein [Arsenicicoccus]
MTRLDHRSAATRAAGLALCALTASVAALSACSTVLPSEQDRARDAVERFAAGMATGQVETESLTRDSRDRAASETPLILAGLGDRRPGVAVVSVERPVGDGVTRLDAQVRYTWQIRAGVTPETTTPCSQRATVDGRSFKNYDDYPADRLGDISLRTAFASSCNTSLISLRDKATQQSLADAAVALGLGTDPALGVPASLGSVPREAVGTEHAASLIGQGKVQTTPLGMATVVASVAAGRVVRPRLVLDAPDPAGDAPRHPLTETEASALRDLMRRTTTEGSGRLLADVPGAPVLSKTGTAEYGSEAPPRTHAWMVAVQGDLAVAVFVEDGAGGAHTAGPVLERFLVDVGAAR